MKQTFYKIRKSKFYIGLLFVSEIVNRKQTLKTPDCKVLSIMCFQILINIKTYKCKYVNLSHTYKIMILYLRVLVIKTISVIFIKNIHFLRYCLFLFIENIRSISQNAVYLAYWLDVEDLYTSTFQEQRQNFPDFDGRFLLERDVRPHFLLGDGNI